MLDRIFGMTLEVNRYLPPGSIIVVSPDVYQALRMDPNVHHYYGFDMGGYQPARFAHTPDGGLTLEQHTQESLAAKYKATDLLIAFRQERERSTRRDMQDALLFAFEADLAWREEERKRRQLENDWYHLWWHGGKGKGYWE